MYISFDDKTQPNNQSNLFWQQSAPPQEDHSGKYPASSSEQDTIANSLAKIDACISENIRKENYAVAIALIDKLISHQPGSAVHYNNRGLMHFKNHHFTKAIDDLNQALTLNPRLDSAYNNRANCYAAQGDLVAAISDYDEALNINPGNLRAWINQGITFRDMKSYGLALENFDICLILGSSFKSTIYGERGRTYHLRGDWNCAVSDYHLSLRLLKETAESESYHSKVQSWLNELISL